ncbi:MAG: DUF362 domain-containing protein [Candidatus Pacearchaeota archaeon]
MSKVYFSKDLDKILEKIDFSKLGKNVAIKLHFGEQGCVTYLSPIFVKKVYDKITSLGKKATLVECNVLYRGSRTNKKDHIKTAISHGFDFAPIDILDGDFGKDEIEVSVLNGFIDKASLGSGLSKYDSMIALSHFKGHPDSGYGGAFKNIGMGLASRAGKLHIHANTRPVINESRCISCGKCVSNCPVNAISLSNGRARINNVICIGCAMCIAVCEKGAVKVPWGSSSHEEVCKKIVDYTRAVLSKIPNIIYLNFLVNITKECDCFGFSQKPIINDIGILYSEDIVSIDKASLDLVNKYSNNKFNKINDVNKDIQVNYAFLKKMGEINYELVELN